MSKSVWKAMLLVIISVALVPCVAMAQGWTGTDPVTTTSKVGIGTATPSFDLHIFRNTAGSKILAIQAQSSGAGTYADTEILADKQAFSLRAYGSGFSTFTHAGVTLTNMAEFWADELSTGGNAGLLIGTNLSSLGPPLIFAANGAERMRIAGATGYVGIGTSTPAYNLDVVGTIHATSVIGATYQDFAEWVPASEQMTAGTVVVLNREKNNEVLPSTSAYDPTVAGVVSAKPGIILGEAAKDKAQIATTGRVRVKVDATRAPIQIGDLLVTSDIAGTAMKSEPIEIQGRSFHQPGTIVGKALEPLSSGKGEILVLLSLQ